MQINAASMSHMVGPSSLLYGQKTTCWLGILMLCLLISASRINSQPFTGCRVSLPLPSMLMPSVREVLLLVLLQSQPGNFITRLKIQWFSKEQ